MLSLVAALASSGGPWVLLQGFAWARMIVVFSQESGLRTAIVQTFSGRRPCALCHAAQRGQHEEGRKAPGLKLELNLEWAPAAENALELDPPLLESGRILHSGSHAQRTDPPPKPPPRPA